MVFIESRRKVRGTLTGAAQPADLPLDILLRLADYGVANWDVGQDQFAFSDRYCQILGYFRGEMPPARQAWIDLIHPEDQSLVTDALDKHFLGKGPFDVQCRVKTKQGDYCWVQFRGEVEFDKNNRAKRVIITMRDITTNKQLERAFQNSRTQLKNLTLRVVERQEAERKHIARELHDGIGQVLTVIKLSLQSVDRNSCDATVAARLAQNIALIDELAGQVRNLSRLLRPPQLDALGLTSALAWYINSLRGSSALNIHLSCDPMLMRLWPDLETNCFRIVQEALTNILRHAKATNAFIELRCCDEKIRVSIKDDGNGFDVAKVRARTSLGECVGLFGIEERAELLGGSVTISSSPRIGTHIEVVLPLLLAKPRSRAKPR